jgi:CheY-like chemotaxis protein
MYKVLIVEDNPHNQRLVEQLLYEITENIEQFHAPSGKIAIELGKKHQFDLVLMDISLPDMDGIDVTRELKKLPKMADIPYIVATAHAMQNDEELFLKTFDDYISKPINDEIFEQKIRKWLGVE